MKLTFLPLLPVALASFAPSSKTPHCTLLTTTTFTDDYGPILTEHHYTCNLTSLLPSTPSPPAITAPAPFSHISGQLGSDSAVNPLGRGSIKPLESAFDQQLLSAQQKRTIHNYGCSLLPDAEPLPKDVYSNLFWGMRELKNQSCIEPGEAKEWTDIERGWSADWRLVAVNRGEKRECEWYQELANVGEALHYYCFFTGGLGVEESGGGMEALAWGGDEKGEKGEGGLRWCMRYSERGWGEDVFEDHCLGV